MNDLSLFDAPPVSNYQDAATGEWRTRVRRDSMPSSVEAAKSVPVNKHQLMVLKAAEHLGTFTDKQLVAHLKISDSSARTRRSELVRANYIEHVGYTTTGRRQGLWRITEAGRRHLARRAA